MGTITFIYALALIAFGVIGYTMGEAKSVTALIPAMFGVLVAICAALAAKPSLRKHAMHGAAGLALVAMLMHLAVFIVRVTKGKAGINELGPQMMMLTAVASSVFLVFAVRSFIQARRRRG